MKKDVSIIAQACPCIIRDRDNGETLIVLKVYEECALAQVVVPSIATIMTISLDTNRSYAVIQKLML